MQATYLAHHGVKGMKWGVWNAETRAKYGHLDISGSDKTSKEFDKAYKQYVKADQKYARVKARTEGKTSPMAKRSYHNANMNRYRKSRALADEYMKDRNLGTKTNRLHTTYGRDDGTPVIREFTETYTPEWDRSVTLGFARSQLSQDIYDHGMKKAMDNYVKEISRIENRFAISVAVDKGSSYVAEYIRDGKTDKARSGVEQGARDGIVIESDKAGKQYLKLKDRAEKTRQKYRDYTEKHSDDDYSVYSSTKTYRRLSDSMSDANYAYAKFKNDRFPYVKVPETDHEEIDRISPRRSRKYLN